MTAADLLTAGTATLAEAWPATRLIDAPLRPLAPGMALASGAGSGAHIAIGTGVLGGMIVGTLLGIFFIPLFYMLVVRTFDRRARAQRQSRTTEPGA